MTLHKNSDTLVLVLLVIGTSGLAIPIIFILRYIDKVQAKRNYVTVALCDCCGSHADKTDLINYKYDGKTYQICTWGRHERHMGNHDKLHTALKTPMGIKYLTPTT